LKNKSGEKMMSGNMANFYRLAALLAVMLVFSANIFADDKYIPVVRTSISDDDGLSWTSNTSNKYTLEAGKPIYLRIDVAIEAKGFFTGNKTMPVYVAFSNGEMILVDAPMDARVPSMDADAVVYSFMAIASKKPRAACIMFQSSTVSTGMQTISISYDDEISRRYDQTVTLTYVNR
jgi:hypothetical protein